MTSRNKCIPTLCPHKNGNNSGLRAPKNPLRSLLCTLDEAIYEKLRAAKFDLEISFDKVSRLWGLDSSILVVVELLVQVPDRLEAGRVLYILQQRLIFRLVKHIVCKNKSICMNLSDQMLPICTANKKSVIRLVWSGPDPYSDKGRIRIRPFPK